MKCPKCGGETAVSNTARTPETVYRERKCLECKYKIYTYEVIGDKLTTRKKLNKTKQKNAKEYEEQLCQDTMCKTNTETGTHTVQ